MRKHALAGQISALEHVVSEGSLRFDAKGVQIGRHSQQLAAALETLRWMHRHETEICAFVAAGEGASL